MSGALKLVGWLTILGGFAMAALTASAAMSDPLADVAWVVAGAYLLGGIAAGVIPLGIAEVLDRLPPRS